MVLQLRFQAIKNLKLYSKLIYLQKVCILFMLFFDVSFVQISGITTSRFAFIYLVLYAFFNKIHLNKKLFLILLGLLALTSIAVVQAQFSEDYTQVSRLFFFTIYSLVCAYILSYWLTNLKEFLGISFICVLVQATILIVSFFNPTVKSFLASFVVYGGNFTIEEMYRAFGLTSTTGSALSIIQALGVISGLMYLFFFENNLLQKAVLSIGVLLILISTALVGRTGLLIGLGAILISIFKSSLRFRSALLIFLLVLINLELVWVENIFSSLDNFSFEYFSGWLSDSFNVNDNKTLAALNDMNVPELNLSTLLGTGKIIGLNGENASGNDSGYIQTYYSLGLIGAIIFYLSILIYLLGILAKFKNQKDKIVALLLLILVYLIENKEPFMFKYTAVFYVHLLFLLFKSSKK